MRDIHEIQATLARMAELLRLGGVDDWAEALDAAQTDVARDTAEALVGIRSWYGGMGSLNDIVLHRSSRPLMEENDELEELRRRLLELCR